MDNCGEWKVATSGLKQRGQRSEFGRQRGAVQTTTVTGSVARTHVLASHGGDQSVCPLPSLMDR